MIYLSLFQVLWMVLNIFESVNAHHKWKKVYFLTIELLLSVFSFGIAILWLILYYVKWGEVGTGIEAEFKGYVVFSNMLADEFWRYEFITSCIVMANWMRALLVFRINWYFGPLIYILLAMIVDLFKFLVIFSITFFMFVTVGSILFEKDLPKQFADLPLSAKYLF